LVLLRLAKCPKLAGTTPVNPLMVKRNINTAANSIGVLSPVVPPHMVAIQLIIFIPVGTAMIIVAAVN
jgi:hypothetical protein